MTAPMCYKITVHTKHNQNTTKTVHRYNHKTKQLHKARMKLQSVPSPPPNHHLLLPKANAQSQKQHTFICSVHITCPLIPTASSPSSTPSFCDLGLIKHSLNMIIKLSGSLEPYIQSYLMDNKLGGEGVGALKRRHQKISINKRIIN